MSGTKCNLLQKTELFKFQLLLQHEEFLVHIDLKITFQILISPLMQIMTHNWKLRSSSSFPPGVIILTDNRKMQERRVFLNMSIRLDSVVSNMSKIFKLTGINETNAASSLIINHCYRKIFAADSIKYFATLSILCMSALLMD